MKYYNSTSEIRKSHESALGAEFQYYECFSGPYGDDGIHFIARCPVPTTVREGRSDAPEFYYYLFYINPFTPSHIHSVSQVIRCESLQTIVRYTYEYLSATVLCFNCNYGVLPANNNEEHKMCEICDGDGRISSDEWFEVGG